MKEIPTTSFPYTRTEDAADATWEKTTRRTGASRTDYYISPLHEIVNHSYVYEKKQDLV